MKKLKKLLLILACTLALAGTPVVPKEEAFAAEQTAAQSTQKIKHPENGWYTLSNGKKRYYVNGKYVTGMYKIGKNYYHFNKNGILQTRYPLNGWYTLSNGKKRYYKNGKCVTGFRKINGKYYYFNENGIMQKKDVTVKNTTYYINENGVLRARRVGTQYYDGKGKLMSSIQAEDFRAQENAKAVVRSVTNSGMTQSQKLQACFNWVISKPYWTWRTFRSSSYDGWPALYANDHFERGKGNCIADAAAFAYLAKELGYTNVYVCTDAPATNYSAHSWAEINGLVYDPLFAEAKNYSRNYGVPYGVYPLHAILHVQIA